MNPYSKHLESSLARVLSLQNRNPASKTYGCFDRNYWHFKTIIDFAAATYQQPILGLSRLVTTPGQPYHRHPQLSAAAKTGLLYWCTMQNKDGSVNEYYDNDHSFCPTAFTTFAAAYSFHLLRSEFTPAKQQSVSASLRKAAQWLASNNYAIVQNQMVASMNALYWCEQVLGESLGFEQRRSEVLAAQTAEGWFPEYSGADVGYSFKVLDFLTLYLEWCPQDGEVKGACEKLVHFINHFLHPDGTAGGAYGSRCTAHVFPYGIERALALGLAGSHYLHHWYRRFLAQEKVFLPAVIDDKYFAYFYFNSFVLAYLHANAHPALSAATTLDFTRPEQKSFPQAGLLYFSQHGWQIWLNTGQKGTCLIYRGEQLCHSDTGYFIKEDEQVFATQGLQPEAKYQVQVSSDALTVEVSGSAQVFDDSYPLERWIVPFKLVTQSVLEVDALARFFNVQLKMRKVAKTKPSKGKVVRKFRFAAQEFTISDELSGFSEHSQMSLGFDSTVIHSPSSRFYQVPFLQAQQARKIREERVGATRQFTYQHTILV